MFLLLTFYTIYYIKYISGGGPPSFTTFSTAEKNMLQLLDSTAIHGLPGIPESEEIIPGKIILLFSTSNIIIIIF